MSFHHSPQIVTDGLVLCLDAGDPKSYSGSGTVWTDRSGNGNNGTLVNGVGFDSANRGSLVFDGVNDYVSVTEAQNMRPSVLTAEITFKCVSTVNTATGGNSGTAQYLLFRQNSRTGNFEGYVVLYQESGSITIGATPSGGSPQFFVNSGIGSAPLGSVIHATAIFNTTTMSVFVNGELKNSGAKGSGINYNDTHTLKIGRSVPEGNNWDSAFNGSIYCVRIYNRALSLTEIQQNFNAQRSRFGI